MYVCIFTKLLLLFLSKRYDTHIVVESFYLQPFFFTQDILTPVIFLLTISQKVFADFYDSTKIKGL